MSHLSLIILILGLLGVNLASSAGAQEYIITRLDPYHPGQYNFSSGTNINNDGVVLGSGSGQYTTDLATVWLPHQTVGTPIFFWGYNRTSPEGINDNGDVVGYGPDNNSQPHGFLNGADLGQGYTNDINNLGQVAGWTYDSLYIYKDGVFDYQPTSYWGSEIYAINDSGVAVGYWFTDCQSDCYSEVCIFRGDSITLLGSVGGGSYAEATDINNRGQMAGWFCDDTDCIQYHGFFWSDGAWYIIPTLGGNGSRANAVNDSGVVVGESYGATPGQRAVIYDTLNGLRDLNNLIPAGSGWELLTASDINNKGQITGVGKYNGLTRAFLLSPPDTSIVITRPELDQLFIGGETDTIRWFAENVDSVRISVLLHVYDLAGQSEFPIVESFPADSGLFIWEIPDSLLSRQCRIVIQATDNPNVSDTGADFKVKGYVLTRVTDDGEYEAFSPTVHGWSFQNSSFIMWPSDWWDQFSYQSGIDPNTNAVYPSFFTDELQADPWDFIDWPLFVKTFGADTCYTTDLPIGRPGDYWPSATNFWSIKSQEHSGSCVGLAATSIAAFGNKDILLQRFPEFGNFDDLYALPLNDTRREIINQLMFTQFARLPQLNEDTVLRNPNETWIQKLKNMFLDEDRSRDAFLGMYNARGGGHAVTPYKLVRDSVPGISGELYLLYVYDNNHPGDSTRAIAIRPSDGFWRYPPTGAAPWLAYGTGLLLEPFSLYLQDAEFPPSVTGKKTLGTDGPGAEDYETIYGLSQAAVMIRSGSDSLGFLDTMVFNSIYGAKAITAKTGYMSRPIGYRFPEQDVDIQLSEFTDSVVSVSVARQEVIYSMSRTGVSPSDTDHYLVRNGVNLWNEDSTSKSLDLQAIHIGPGLEKVFTVEEFDLNQSDSAYFDASSGDLLYLVNVGAEEFYDLTLRLASPSGGAEVEIRNILVGANSGHLIWPDWNDLTSPIRIEIDENNDGPVDDTIYVYAQSTDIEPPSGGNLPLAFELQQNYPNPFNPVTTIAYSLPARAQVTVEVFNVLGQRVRTLVDEMKPAGTYRVEWNGTDQFGQGAASGVYLYRLRAGDIVLTKKMLLVK